MNDELSIIINAIEEKNGEQTAVIDLDGLSIMADNFIITSASNERQVNAIVENVEEKMSKEGVDPLRIEGRNSGRWILMDYGDNIVHVFHKDERIFYNLEKLWNENNNTEYINEKSREI